MGIKSHSWCQCETCVWFLTLLENEYANHKGLPKRQLSSPQHQGNPKIPGRKAMCTIIHTFIQARLTIARVWWIDYQIVSSETPLCAAGLVFDLVKHEIFHEIQWSMCPEKSKIQTQYFRQVCIRSVWALWHGNCLPKEIRLCNEIEAFARTPRTHLFVQLVNGSTLAIYFEESVLKRPRMFTHRLWRYINLVNLILSGQTDKLNRWKRWNPVIPLSTSLKRGYDNCIQDQVLDGTTDPL